MKFFIKYIAIFSLLPLIMVSCKDGNSSGDKGSNIKYLKSNHSSYQDNQYGKIGNRPPAPTQDDANTKITWAIVADSLENAEKLEKHIKFMVNKLKDGETPRAFDRLFLMEAYMKQNHYYTTSIQRSGKEVTIVKAATNQCAYRVIKAHSSAVSGDFFGKGDIRQDYSSIADTILNSSECSSMKSSISNFISTH